MKNFLQDIIIGVLIFVICLIIAIVTGANFLWLFLPLVIIVLLAVLGNLLRQRYGSTYGITVYLFLFLVVPILWYLFCSQMPITAVTLKTQQKAEDFSSFKNYEGSIDAKKQFVDYQMKQDSITNQNVSKLLSENKVDEALQLIKDNKAKIEKLKKELLSNSQIESSEDLNKSTRPSFTIKKNKKTELISVPDKTTMYFESQKPFYILEIRDLNKRYELTEVPMPSGQSSRYWLWGGVVTVRSNEDNRITIWTNE